MSQTDRRFHRPTGASATLGRTGFPTIVSATGGRLDIKTGVEEAGFNPLDLLYASLSACLAMSARSAAVELGLRDRLSEITVDVRGVKAPDDPARVTHFEIDMHLTGDLDAQTKQAIAHRAEESLCTVSNTLKGTASFGLTIREG
ncbi:ABC transporter ATP-binding protein [Rhizobium rhizosphaerae]|uniref:ABC transporter ATP-binding protein n=1 Tax=Xaviernesmea rhizosphaerae TaxID=1672749 RepID=A0ABX3PEI4_9HYPH|nr:OsmC family protein [Xaviernesmea rhizosphaerae]OQP86491.1 ABC transporter ATP-binding protein [Xaviernesmea rhizosphaerae]